MDNNEDLSYQSSDLENKLKNKAESLIRELYGSSSETPPNGTKAPSSRTPGNVTIREYRKYCASMEEKGIDPSYGAGVVVMIRETYRARNGKTIWEQARAHEERKNEGGVGCSEYDKIMQVIEWAEENEGDYGKNFLQISRVVKETELKDR